MFNKLIEKLKNPFGLVNGVKLNPARKVYQKENYQSWGNAIYWLDKPTDYKIYGFIASPKIKEGDELRIRLSSGRIGCLIMYNIDYKNDPRDMFFANVKELGFLDELEQNPLYVLKNI